MVRSDLKPAKNDPDLKDPVLFSRYRGVIKITLHVVGIMEYWEKRKCPHSISYQNEPNILLS